MYHLSNTVKEKLQRSEPSYGLFFLSGSAMIAEACATLPIDWMIIDMEAGIYSRKDVLHVYQAMNNSRVSPMVRVQENNKSAIEFALDLGSAGVLIPKVENAAEAESASKCFYYFPQGNRGVNPVRSSGYFTDMATYFSSANSNQLAMVQIESAEAVENCDAIAAVEGIDLLFIGCGDLACSYGQAGNVEGAKMDDARRKVLAACHKHGKFPGIFAYSTELAKQYAKEGFIFIAIGNEIKLLKEAIGRSIP